MPNRCNHCHNSRTPKGECEWCGSPITDAPEVAAASNPPQIPVSIAHARQDAELLRHGACMPYLAANTIERLCDRVEALEARDVDADVRAVERIKKAMRYADSMLMNKGGV